MISPERRSTLYTVDVVARGDQEVPVRVDCDRVEVEVVEMPWIGRIDAVRLVERHVVEAVPLEQDASRVDIDLLDNTLDGITVDRGRPHRTDPLRRSL